MAKEIRFRLNKTDNKDLILALENHVDEGGTVGGFFIMLFRNAGRLQNSSKPTNGKYVDDNNPQLSSTSEENRDYKNIDADFLDQMIETD